MKPTALYTFLANNTYLLVTAIVGLTMLMLALMLLPAETFSHSKLFSYDKIGHFLLFGSWTLLLGLYHNIALAGNTNIWVIFLIGTSFGIFIEFLQYSLPALNRHADLYDILFDAGGCLFAVFLLRKIIPGD